jgi:thymidine kinase
MGKIVFNYGCMGSGKTSKMLTQFDSYKRRRKNPIIVKPCVDTRETTGNDTKFIGWGVTKSRITKNEEPTYYFEDLRESLSLLDFGVLFVDEAQFLTREDVLTLCDIADIRGIDVFCYGLKTVINGELFEGSKHLLALADEFIEIDTPCEIDRCDGKAICHIRFVNGEIEYGGPSVEIEQGNVTYKSVCRKHWHHL